MSITLGAVVFDRRYTAVQEKYEEVGGSDERVVILNGIVAGESTVADIEARLDAVLESASVSDYSTILALRSGRRLNVRRNSFQRDINADQLTGSFRLELGARDPFEESDAETSVVWNVAVSGATQGLSTSGNTDTHTVVTLVAAGSVVNPVVSDGMRSISYSGTVADGETLVFDGESGLVTLEGVDVTGYTAGEFPRVSPGGSTFTYTDDVISSNTAAVTVRYRDRWV